MSFKDWLDEQPELSLNEAQSPAADVLNAAAPSDRWLVLMRPGAGATTLSLLWAQYLLSEGKSVVYAASTTDLVDYKTRHLKADYPGKLLGVGIGNTLVGFRADAVILDSPVSSWQFAQNARFRNRLRDWVFGDLSNRLASDGVMVVLMSRWGDDDLPSDIMQRSNWDVLDVEGDPRVLVSMQEAMQK
jgi:hypothetical protein